MSDTKRGALFMALVIVWIGTIVALWMDPTTSVGAKILLSAIATAAALVVLAVVADERPPA